MITKSMTSTIAFFSNHFARSSGTGVTRYACNLVKAFKESDSPYNLIPIATWSNKKADELNNLQVDTGLRLLPTGRWFTPLLWWSIDFPKLEHLLEFNVDLIHVNDLSYLVSTSKPYVITIHDIGPLTHPKFFRNNSFLITQKSLEYAIKKAAAFICVSKATANALQEYVQLRYSVDLSNRTHVIYEGIADNFLRNSKLSVPNPIVDGDYLRQPFILAVGKISPRKNLEMVIRALKRLEASIPHHLVTVGGDAWDFEGVKNLVNSLGLVDRVHFLGYVNDELLNMLYSKATLFVHLSLFEGFGLPLLEAMTVGCPVVTSNVSSLPEVAGDAALLVDPYDLEDVAFAIDRVCRDQNLATELGQKGRKRASQFSWAKCAKETLAIYSALLG